MSKTTKKSPAMTMEEKAEVLEGNAESRGAELAEDGMDQAGDHGRDARATSAPSAMMDGEGAFEGLNWEEEIRAIAVGDLVPSPFNMRRRPSDSELGELVASIKAQGQLQNGVCRPHPSLEGKFEIVAGERRWRALVLAGAAMMAMSLRNLSDAEAVLVNATENNQRKDLTPMEEAQTLQLLIDHGYTVADAAERLGRSMKWVARRKSLVGLSASWKILLGWGRGAESSEEGFDQDGDHGRDARATETGDHGRDARATETAEAAAAARLREMMIGADVAAIVQAWPASWLEMIARLPVSTQDEVMEVLNDRDWQECNGVEIETECQGLMRGLSAAPWKQKDAELVPAAGACSVCPKRTSCQMDLFDEENHGRDAHATHHGRDARATKKRKSDPDQCLDPVCWEAKLQAFAARRVEELRITEGAEPVLITTKYHWTAAEAAENPLLKNAIPTFKANRCTESTLGARAAVILDGPEAGKTVYVLGDRRASAKGGIAAEGGGRGESSVGGQVVKTMKEREEGLLKKRRKEADRLFMLEIAALIQSSEASKHEDEVKFKELCERVEVKTAIAYLLAYGCESHFDARGWPGDSQKEFARLRASEGMGRLGFAAVRKILGEAVRKHSMNDVDGNWKAMGIYCEVLGMDREEFFEAAAIAIQEPKGWAALRLAEKNAGKKDGKKIRNSKSETRNKSEIRKGEDEEENEEESDRKDAKGAKKTEEAGETAALPGGAPAAKKRGRPRKG